MPRSEENDKGVVFPTPLNKKKVRSTTEPGKAVIAAALGEEKGSTRAQLDCLGEKNWRFGYVRHFRRLVAANLKCREDAVASAKLGLAKAAEFTFIGGDGKRSTVAEEMARPLITKESEAGFLWTGVVEGTGSAATDVVLPLKNASFKNAQIGEQLDRWAAKGVMEADAAAAVKWVVESPANRDLKGRTFVLIGAGSAMGPLSTLLGLGATIYAIDIPGIWGKGTKRPASGMWTRFFDMARRSRGRLVFPLTKPAAGLSSDLELAEAAGVSLSEAPRELLSWVLNAERFGDFSGGKPKHVGGMTVGNYTYMDSGLHVRLSIAADQIISGLCAARKDTSVAFLCTPTDIHLVSKEVQEAAGRKPSLFALPIETLVKMLSFGKYLQSNVFNAFLNGSASYPGVDCLAVAQGPNYALAKRLQHFRAVVAYEAGHAVSSNIAPSTATVSVVHNKMFARAYAGMPYFEPYEIFAQETTTALMALLLVHDVMNPKGVARSPASQLRHPLCLFEKNQVHGGMFRARYSADSIGTMSVIIFFCGGPKLFLPVAYALLGALAAFLKFWVF